MKSRRSKSSDGKRKKKSFDEELGFHLVDDSAHIEADSLHNIIEGTTATKETVLTKSPFFYDLRTLWYPKDEDGNTRPGFWMHFFIWAGGLFYTALIIMEGLEIVSVGWDNPIFYMIFHFALTLFFGILATISIATFTIEPILKDHLTPSIVSVHAFGANGISGILLMVWVVTNTGFIFDVDYDKDPSGTVDYKDTIVVCFIFYFIWLTLCILAYSIHFAFAKFVEILSMTVRQLDNNPTRDYLETLLYKADAYLNRDNTNTGSSASRRMKKTRKSKKRHLNSSEIRSRRRNKSNRS